MTTIWFFDTNDWCDEQDLAMLHFFCGDLCPPTQSHEEQEAAVLFPQHDQPLSPEYEPTAVAPETLKVAAPPLFPPATAVPPLLSLVPPLAVTNSPSVDPPQASLKKAWHNKLTLRERGTKFSDLLRECQNKCKPRRLSADDLNVLGFLTEWEWVILKRSSSIRNYKSKEGTGVPSKIIPSRDDVFGKHRRLGIIIAETFTQYDFVFPPPSDNRMLEAQEATVRFIVEYVNFYKSLFIPTTLKPIDESISPRLIDMDITVSMAYQNHRRFFLSFRNASFDFYIELRGEEQVQICLRKKFFACVHNMPKYYQSVCYNSASNNR